jgi:hypothetical protein
VREIELLREVGKLCRRYDVDLHHTHQSPQNSPGWVDCALLGTRAAFRELKTRTGRLSAAQQRTRERMRAADLDWATWRPADLESGRIDREIAALSGRRPWTQPAR